MATVWTYKLIHILNKTQYLKQKIYIYIHFTSFFYFREQFSILFGRRTSARFQSMSELPQQFRRVRFCKVRDILFEVKRYFIMSVWVLSPLVFIDEYCIFWRHGEKVHLDVHALYTSWPFFGFRLFELPLRCCVTCVFEHTEHPFQEGLHILIQALSFFIKLMMLRPQMSMNSCAMEILILEIPAFIRDVDVAHDSEILD